MKKLKEKQAQLEMKEQKRLDKLKAREQLEEEMSTGDALSPRDLLKSLSSASRASTTTTTNKERAIVPIYVPPLQRPRPSMVEVLLQRLVQDPNARVAPCSHEIIEEIMMDLPPQATATMDKDKKDQRKAFRLKKTKLDLAK